uniref:Epicuticlin n=1 Tax=Haemonchus contortus TaxID=6289 RepID=W6N8X0_HAECO
MNPVDSVVVLLLTILAIIAVPVEKRQAGDNSYGDEPNLPISQSPYIGVEATTIITVPEEEAQPVMNPLPSGPSPVVDSGYRAKRQAGDNTYGDEPVVPSQGPYAESDMTTVALIPEEEAPAVSMPAPEGPVAPVVESGY